MTHIFVGADVGLSGAIGCISEAGRLVDVVRMPTVPIGKSRRVCGRQLREWLESVENSTGASIALVMIEQVAARPGQGVTSMFSFGRSLGVIEGVVSALGLPFDYISPAAWKKSFGLGSDKAESIRKAIDLIPGLAGWPNPKGPTHDQAEAVLLAEYARRRWSGMG